MRDHAPQQLDRRLDCDHVGMFANEADSMDASSWSVMDLSRAKSTTLGQIKFSSNTQNTNRVRQHLKMKILKQFQNPDKSSATVSACDQVRDYEVSECAKWRS